MSASFDLVAADGQIVTALISDASGAVTIYEDAGCTIQAPEATVSAFQSTETTRRFYVTAPGAYTLTIIEDATTIATVDITLSSTTSAVCGPYRATAAQPASNVIDGGTP